jgi:hypothetical protein
MGYMKKFIKKIVPTFLLNYYRKIKRLCIAEISLIRHKQNLRRISGKYDVYNVIFLLEHASCWKYKSLYNKFEKSKNFHPIIVICPNVKKNKDEMIFHMQNTYDEMQKEKYRLLQGYNAENDTYLNIRELSPHIIFFTNAWEGYMHKNFHIDQFNDILTCYMNYGFATTPYEWSFVTDVSIRSWRYFQECVDYTRILKQWTHGKNAIVTGSPMYDAFIEAQPIGKDWKINKSGLKRVIYAPHHSIPDIADGLYGLSTFLIHANTMLEIADLYKDKIQFVFKPHPLLRNHLYLHLDWGKKKTDEYYEKWISGENTNYINGEYIDLFKTSDAIIHDCSSFTMEYLFVRKPALFLSNKGHEGQSNEVAMRAYSAHYKAKTKNEICDFLDSVVIMGCDPLKVEREQFYSDVLLPPNNCTASENIFDNISDLLKIQK